MYFKIVPCRVRAAAPTLAAASLPACRRQAGNGRERTGPGWPGRSAPLLGASIFLDALNVFLFFLRILSRES